MIVKNKEPALEGGEKHRRDAIVSSETDGDLGNRNRQKRTRRGTVNSVGKLYKNGIKPITGKTDE